MDLIFGSVVHTTEKAVLWRVEDTDQEIWIPRSVIDGGEDTAVGEEELYVKTWFLEANDLI